VCPKKIRPESDARELCKDLGEFIRNIKTKCGKLLVKSQKEKQKNRKHKCLIGTPNLPPQYEESIINANKQIGLPTDY